MPGFADSLLAAFQLLASLDGEMAQIVVLSLQVSLIAACIAFAIGAPLGALLAIYAFPGRQASLVLVNALQGLPPVVVGLAVYLLLSRAGAFGFLGLLFTPGGMIIAQVLLAVPIVTALSHRLFEGVWRKYGDSLKLDDTAFPVRLGVMASMARASLATVFLTAFGRVIAEVGAIMIVGGNIRGVTRTMTTTIALETSKGDLPLALALGMVLIAITVAISALALHVGKNHPHT